MRHTAIIIEDEYLAAEELLKMLSVHPEIEVLAIADSVASALEQIEKNKPQLLFLDINLNGSSGFDILEKLDEVPLVIFVTAYDQYALKAFEVSALDYLLKPINPQRLSETIQKVKKQFLPTEQKEPRLSIEKRIFIKDGEQCFFVPLVEVHLVESVGNYARVYYGNNKPLLHKSLNYLEEKLPESHFFRANRQYLINIHFIQNINSYFNNTLQVEMPDGIKIEISQRQSVKFKELMGV
ncbi:LytTR family DNA-binding domain-containing protein [Haliscomenobacter sp.]|uniref:LytR/AlgR family response regulator transcription factor n=1 Tax=Haliscomenobacter sp. TaxID=2717303 RepID=UPI003364CD8E